MKKKIMTFALSSMSAISFADVNLYGRVAVGLEQDAFQNTTVPQSGNIQDMGSYFGIRGSDPIYGETAAVWQVEQFLDIASGQAYYQDTASGMIAPAPGATSNAGRVKSETNVLAGGETYLGLQGGWGFLRLGNISNYMRAQMGNVDLYNYNNGVNGLGTYSRTSRLLSTAIGYSSPVWNGFSLSGMYSYQSNGGINISSVNAGNNLNANLNGYYSGGVISGGIGYNAGPIVVRLGGQLYQNVGEYNTGVGIQNGSGVSGSSVYKNAYNTRLELGYDSGEDAIVGIGYQVSSGLGWASWANSGGSFNNFIYNGNAPTGLTAAQYQTQEVAATLGWHLGPWTPKVSYAYGGNMMYGGNMWNVITGTANQINGTGYNQVVAELDWNVTPKTIVFANFGQQWWGSTLQNVSYCGTACSTAGTVVDGSNQYKMDQLSAAIGFTHTF